MASTMTEENGELNLSATTAEEALDPSIPSILVSANISADKATIAKLSAQLKRMNDANTKYKNLLMLAKDRITKQEEEFEELKVSKQGLEERLISDEKEAAGRITLDEAADKNNESESKIINIVQRIKVPVTLSEGYEEIWALVEYEIEREYDAITGPSVRRYKEWKRFDNETALQDYIRRDTGEPLVPPPYSLSPDQSAKLQRDAESEISKVTEEFRRFRVRAELARKQADTQIKDLQSSQMHRAAQRIAGQDGPKDNDKIRILELQIQQLKSEISSKDMQFKNSFDTLVAENAALKSTGSEALLASQWRQRYESCLKEKEELESRLGSSQQASKSDDKFEEKYRDLKESFRLYRKKAKEIFEAQQGVENGGGLSSAIAMQITSNSSPDAKLSYLKNLMINYLSAAPAVRGHMEGAIGTVLQFSPEELRLLAKKKAESEAWF